MHRLLPILIITLALIACNGTDPAVKSADSAIRNSSDTMKASADTTIKKIDSAISATADTLKSKINAIADSAKKAVRK